MTLTKVLSTLFIFLAFASTSVFAQGADCVVSSPKSIQFAGRLDRASFSIPNAKFEPAPLFPAGTYDPSVDKLDVNIYELQTEDQVGSSNSFTYQQVAAISVAGKSERIGFPVVAPADYDGDMEWERPDGKTEVSIETHWKGYSYRIVLNSKNQIISLRMTIPASGSVPAQALCLISAGD
jgi:hypothetical protein